MPLMDAYLKMAGISALIVAVLGYAIWRCLRTGWFETPQLVRVTRSEMPGCFWTAIGILAVFMVVMVCVTVACFVAWL